MYKIAVWYYLGAIAAVLLAMGRFMVYAGTYGRG